MSVVVSREARRDLQRIRRYITEELGNPAAAVRIIAALKKSAESLRDFPGRGQPLDALMPVHTAYRYLPCEHYCIFYLCSETDVLIVRILHQRQDCLRALLMG